MEFSALNTKLHNRKNFDCGVEALNRYLKQVAGQDQKRNLSKVYALAEGDALIFHAFKTTQEAAERVGILGIIVDAKDESAASFYEGFGFVRLQGSSRRLVRNISALSTLLAGK